MKILSLETYLYKTGKNYIVTRDLKVYLPRIKQILIIPKGFVTNLYSGVPDLTDPFPAVCHDYLYRHKEVNGIKVSRKTSDQIFLDLMRKSPLIDQFYAKLYYVGVRTFGWIFWNSHLL